MCQRKGKNSPPTTLRSSGLNTESLANVAPKSEKTWPRYSISSSRSSLQGSSSNGSTSEITKPPNFFSVRGLFVFLGFLGGGLVFAVRVNINLAIVAMVKSTKSPQELDSITGSSFEEHDLCFDPSVTVNANSSWNSTLPSVTKGEFEWTPTEIGHVLAAYFYGYTLTQVFAGRLAEKYGGLWVEASGVLIPGILTLFTPLAARHSVIALIVLRIIIGIAASSFFSAHFQMMTVWTPEHERGSAIGWATVGGDAFAMATMFISGYICDDPQLGWPWMFYLTGALSIVWVFLWIGIMRCDNPNDHPWISQAELDYIKANLGDTKLKKKAKAPWLKIATSKCVWALIVVRFTGEFGFYVLTTKLPQYLEAIFNVPITSNGIFNGLVYVSLGLSECTIGYLTDFISTKPWVGLTMLRKITQTISMLGPGIALLLVPAVGCNYAAVLGLIFVSQFLYGFLCGGELPLITEYSGDLSGTIFGIVNSAGSISGILAPLITALFLESHNGSRGDWNAAFYTTGAVYLFGMVIFDLFATSEAPSWVYGGFLTQANDVEANRDQHTQAKADSQQGICNEAFETTDKITTQAASNMIIAANSSSGKQSSLDIRCEGQERPVYRI